MGDFGSSFFSLSNLMCDEDETVLNGEMEDENTYMNSEYDIYENPFQCSANEDEEEYIQKLFKRETSFGSKSYVVFDDCACTNLGWLQSARLDAIEWILNAKALFGFQLHTAYLSIDYFDRFFSKRLVEEGKSWAIRLLSMACLSLAAKMEECKVPALSDFPVVDYGFENQVIKKMELLVLAALEWRLGSITPFAFLHYFISKFHGECRPKELVSRAVELIMATTKDINMTDHRPSTVASVAVLAASDDQMTRQTIELKTNGIPLLDSIEHIHKCYNLMQGMQNGNLKTPKTIISRNLSSMISINGSENSSFIFGVGSKRRLTYNEYDQDSESKKACQR